MVDYQTIQMEKIAGELQNIVDKYSAAFAAIPDAVFSHQPSSKWSKKEVVGHLVDSAQNNLRRFITGQYETSPHIIYEQEFWVKASDYQHMKAGDVVALWKLVNMQICSVLRSMPVSNYSRTCNTGRESDSLHTLLWLAEDYVKHLKHHINQVISGSFDITYP
jgi:hypothetical protein